MTANIESVLSISGVENGQRVESRILEERIQSAVREGRRDIEVLAHGQHGIGGRLWQAGGDPVRIRVTGSSGQRLGSMGFPNTTIEVLGPVSDDVGWLNGGARIVVHGQATNGVGNAMAQGQICIAGDIGARGMTMTKHNPRFEPPELWVLGSVGDSFAEFMAGGIAVVCGEETVRPNVLGYRPCVGMVGGKIFFRGNQEGISERDARLTVPGDEDWDWLVGGMEKFLTAISRTDLFSGLTKDRSQWQLIVARRPYEKAGSTTRSIARFRQEVWDRELGAGGLIGDLWDQDRSPIEIIPTGDLRRWVPAWENDKYLSPCQAGCPTGIPVQKRWELIRQGKLEEAVDLALAYTPFPATVCGYLCPNLCMKGCTRQLVRMPSLDIKKLGQASLHAKTPEPAPSSGKKVAVIGGGPAGLSLAWQLWMRGHEPVVHEMADRLGGKVTASIPRNRIPDEVVDHELTRVRSVISEVAMTKPLTPEAFLELKEDYDFIVVATGAQKPRMIPVPGKERAIPALEFLQRSKCDDIRVGKTAVIIGAGNVGCDAAAEAARLGAREITLIDIQEPASYGAERKHAEAVGAKFLWPRFTKAITPDGVELTSGEFLPAETVIVAIGDQPDLSFLPGNIETERGFIKVDDRYRSSDPQVYAIGDSVRLGLLTEAIGAGRTAARVIDDILRGREDNYDNLPSINPARIRLEYYNPRADTTEGLNTCSAQCASCGACRDCGVCEAICPVNAISRRSLGESDYEYIVDGDLCIGCGFCAGACPCGIWELVENTPLE